MVMLGSGNGIQGYNIIEAIFESPHDPKPLDFHLMVTKGGGQQPWIPGNKSEINRGHWIQIQWPLDVQMEAAGSKSNGQWKRSGTDRDRWTGSKSNGLIAQRKSPRQGNRGSLDLNSTFPENPQPLQKKATIVGPLDPNPTMHMLPLRLKAGATKAAGSKSSGPDRALPPLKAGRMGTVGLRSNDPRRPCPGERDSS